MSMTMVSLCTLCFSPLCPIDPFLVRCSLVFCSILSCFISPSFPFHSYLHDFHFPSTLFIFILTLSLIPSLLPTFLTNKPRLTTIPYPHTLTHSLCHISTYIGSLVHHSQASTLATLMSIVLAHTLFHVTLFLIRLP